MFATAEGTVCPDQSIQVTAANGLCQSIQSYESPDWAHAQFDIEAGLIEAATFWCMESTLMLSSMPRSISVFRDVLLSRFITTSFNGSDARRCRAIGMLAAPLIFWLSPQQTGNGLS